jgi:hypothetical protein
VNTLDFGAQSTTSNGDDSRTAVLAAAEQLRAWIHTQKAGWRDPSRPFADTGTLPPAFAVPIPSPADHSSVATLVLAVAEPGADGEFLADAIADTSAPPRTRITLPALPEGLVPWLMRAAAAAAVASAVVGASWAFRASWPSLKPAPNVGTATLESEPSGATIVVDGTTLGTTPLTTDLPAGRHVVDFRRRGVTRTIPIDVVKGKSTSTRVEWIVRRVGRLEVQSEPKGAKVLLDGKERGETPVTIDDVPAGSHTVVLQSGAGTLQRTVTIAEDKTLEMKEAIFSGWLHVSSPIELQIIDGRAGVRLDDRNQALLKPGTHELRFVNKALGFADSRKIDVKPGETTTLSIVPPPSTLTVTASEPSEVLVDGERAGDTPLTDFPIAIGTRDVTVKGATDVRRTTITVTTAPAVLEIDFSKP